MHQAKYTMTKLTIIMAVLSFLALSVSAEAATYYVSNKGSDSAAGTSSNAPFATISKVQSVVRAGDKVYFDRAGTWTASSGTAVLSLKGGVTYIGDAWGNGTRATLRASGRLSRAVVRFSGDDATYETAIQGFNVDGNSKLVDLIYVDNGNNLTGATKRIQNCVAHDTGSGNYYYGILVGPTGGSTVANVEILDNEVYHTAWSAIVLYPYYDGSGNMVKNAIVRNNYVHDTLGPNGSHGIMVGGARVVNATIEYNYINNADAWGLEFASKESIGTTGFSNIVARNNIVTGCGAAVDFWATGSGNYFDITLSGNIFFNNSKGIYFDSSTSGKHMSLRVYNNTFYNNGGPSEININSQPNFSLFEIKNNIIYGGTAIGGYTNLVTAQSNNLTSNPNFKNTGNLPTAFTGTYGVNLAPNHDGLSTESGPAIDAGANLGASYNTSINSVIRPNDGGWDIGAYQHQSSSSALPSAPGDLRIVAQG